MTQFSSARALRLAALFALAGAGISLAVLTFAGHAAWGLAVAAGMTLGAAGALPLETLALRSRALGPAGFGAVSMLKLGLLTILALTLGGTLGRGSIVPLLLGLAAAQLLLAGCAATIAVRSA